MTLRKFIGDKPLWGLKVDGPMGRRFLRGLSLTAAMPLRVVEGASKFIEGASLYKTFTTGLRPWENHTTALRASEMHPFWWLAPYGQALRA